MFSRLLKKGTLYASKADVLLLLHESCITCCYKCFVWLRFGGPPGKLFASCFVFFLLVFILLASQMFNSVNNTAQSLIVDRFMPIKVRSLFGFSPTAQNLEFPNIICFFFPNVM